MKQAGKAIKYDRSSLSPGVVHVGVGGFHRAHQQWYLHRLFEQGTDHDWAVIGAGVRPYDAKMRQKLIAQDHLTTLIELIPGSTRTEVVGPMIDYLPVEETHHSLTRQMADPAIRIVSLTITEGGYFMDPASREFEAEHPDIQHDAQHLDQPKTVFGAMVAALKQRKENGIPPFCGLSCDNIRGNGDILRQTVTSLARLSDAGLAEWIDTHASFPNSMVDCIVPATGPQEMELARSIGVNDAAPVTHEPFRQWVIEDKFCMGRPQLERVGVIFSERVHDYETMKLRILNGGHQIIALAGELLGLATIAETMQHPRVNALFHAITQHEIAPHVRAVPEYSVEQYIALIAERLANPAIVDTTRRVAFDGSSRQPGFIVPAIQAGLAGGTSVSGLALVSAFWARYCAGSRENGERIVPNDPFWSQLTERAARAKDRPMEWLEMTNIYGTLAELPRFSDAFTNWLTLIYDQGVDAAMDEYLNIAANDAKLRACP